MYRGILMPFSSDGDTIDFIYGVINWKEVADHATCSGIETEASRAAVLAPAVEASPIWADGPHAEALASEPFANAIAAAVEFGVEDADDQHDLDLPVDPNAGLADRPLHRPRDRRGRQGERSPQPLCTLPRARPGLRLRARRRSRAGRLCRDPRRCRA
jgi:hypothetical protein